MKKTLFTYRMAALVMAIASLASCQMENDLRGSKKDTVGYVDATMIPQATEPMLTTRAASETTYDVNDFPVAILSAEDADTVARFDSYREMKEAGRISLPQGNYRLVAWMGTDGGNVQTTPYFEGSSDFEILPATTSKVQTTCKLARIKVSVNISEEFEQAFEDDYSLTFHNGRGVETMDATTKHLSYYFKREDGDKTIQVTVKATNKTTKQDITKSFILYKQGENADDGSQLDLEDGDAFRISLTPSETNDGTVINPTEGSFIITAEIKWNDRTEEVEIPIEVMDTDDPNADNDNNNGDEDSEGPVLTPNINDIETWTLDLPYKTSAQMKVDIDAPAGIEELKVNISSSSLGFMFLVGNMHLEEFDLCNIQDATTENHVKNTLVLPYNEDVKGQTHFSFDVSSFTYSLSGFAGEHHFAITVKDAEGHTSSGTLTVTCEGDPTIE